MDQKKDSNRNPESGVDRRSLLKMGVGAAGGALLPGVPAVALAADKPAIGNYPAGVSGDSVFIGLTLDLTGPYSAEGAEEQKGYELAAEQLNAGSPEVKKISPHTKKGILGKTVKLGIIDAQTKPNSAVQGATRFIHDDQAMMISGSVSSAVAIAQIGRASCREGVCQYV